MSTLTPTHSSGETPARRRVWPVGIRSLGHRNYRLFFAGQLISVVGSWMQNMAQAWLVYRLTGSELLLGLAGFADKVPVFLLGLAGGLVADRFNRHRVVIATQTASMIQALALGALVLSGHAQVWQIFVLATVQGVINAFDLPARQSFISAMVERDDLPNALALNSSVFNAARVVGPALAGIVVAAVGEGLCFVLNGVSYMAVIACLAMMRFGPASRLAAPSASTSRLAEGIRYAAGNPPIRSLLLLLGLISICGMPYVVLMPVFAGEILGGGARGLGTLMGASGIGAFVAAAALARRGTVRGLGRVVAAGAIGFGVSLVLFSLSRSFWLSAGILAVVGFSMITMAAATNLLLQSLCPEQLRGRIMSIYVIMFVGMSPWGSLMAGALAHRIGTPHTVAVGGLLCALAGVGFAFGIPWLRGYVRYPIPESRSGPIGEEDGMSAGAPPR